MSDRRNVSDIIAERHHTHGDSFAQMRTTGALWGDLLFAAGWTPPANQPAEVTATLVDMMMIANKLSRAAHGDPSFVDHWDDIKGYSDLASEHSVKERGKHLAEG